MEGRQSCKVAEAKPIKKNQRSKVKKQCHKLETENANDIVKIDHKQYVHNPPIFHVRGSVPTNIFNNLIRCST